MTGTPTDDERDALTRVVGMILGESDDMQAMSDDAFDNIQDSIVAAVLDAGFRRSEPQGEPSDTQVSAFFDRFNQRRDETWWEAARDALRSAWGTR